MRPSSALKHLQPNPSLIFTSPQPRKLHDSIISTYAPYKNLEQIETKRSKKSGITLHNYENRQKKLSPRHSNWFSLYSIRSIYHFSFLIAIQFGLYYLDVLLSIVNYWFLNCLFVLFALAGDSCLTITMISELLKIKITRSVFEAFSSLIRQCYL
jgi:hypothetical protein